MGSGGHRKCRCLCGCGDGGRFVWKIDCVEGFGVGSW